MTPTTPPATTPPDSTLADLRADLDDWASHDRVLFATDFDGVIAPLVLDPTQSRPLPGTMDSLRTLAAAPDTHVALVSGRDLDTLALLTGVVPDDGIVLIGSHGAQSNRPGSGESMSAAQRDLLQVLTTELKAALAAFPDARLEFKPTASVVHTRGVETSQATAALAAAREVATRHTGVRALAGKDVVELTVMSADKGSAVAGLARELGVEAIAYCGDDRTDEDAFAILRPGDLGIKVGAGDTVAAYRVASPEELAPVLAVLAAARAGRLDR